MWSYDETIVPQILHDSTCIDVEGHVKIASGLGRRVSFFFKISLFHTINVSFTLQGKRVWRLIFMI